jgi:hypothetical protein
MNGIKTSAHQHQHGMAPSSGVAAWRNGNRRIIARIMRAALAAAIGEAAAWRKQMSWQSKNKQRRKKNGKQYQRASAAHAAAFIEKRGVGMASKRK